MAARMAGFNPAMEAAIQPFRETAEWRQAWMAGSKPGHDEGSELRSHLRVRAFGLIQPHHR
jgi:hypothetical protein